MRSDMTFMFWLPPYINNSIRAMALTLTAMDRDAGFSGTETCVLELARNLSRRGHRSLVVGARLTEEQDPNEELVGYIRDPVAAGGSAEQMQQVL